VRPEAGRIDPRLPLAQGPEDVHVSKRAQRDAHVVDRVERDLDAVPAEQSREPAARDRKGVRDGDARECHARGKDERRARHIAAAGQ